MVIELLSKENFDEIFSIMEKSFPVDEYRERNKQLTLFQEKSYKVYGAREGDLKGFIAVWELKGCTFIEHLAVKESYRNAGVGGALLQEIIAHYGNEKVVLEVELPLGETERRRIGFYERNGFHLNEFPYLQPSLGSGEKPLLIMSTLSKISQSEFEPIKREIYETVYKLGY